MVNIIDYPYLMQRNHDYTAEDMRKLRTVIESLARDFNITIVFPHKAPVNPQKDQSCPGDWLEKLLRRDS